MKTEIWFEGVKKSIKDVEAEITGELSDVVENCIDDMLTNYYFGGEGKMNRKPKSVAASTEYAARLLKNEKMTMVDISEKYSVGTNTIRETYQEVVDASMKTVDVDLKELKCDSCKEIGLCLVNNHPKIDSSSANQRAGHVEYTNLICPECGTVQSGEQNVWEYEH